MSNTGLRERYNSIKSIHANEDKRQASQDYGFETSNYGSQSKKARQAGKMIRSDIQWLTG
jgi:hypothetical protein